MRYSELSTGRVFILRLESGEVLHEAIESFSQEHNIQAAFLTAVGGVDKGSKMVVGPELPVEKGIVPQIHILDAPHELTASGTLFPDEDGKPLMHMHGSAGRDGRSVTGCLRAGMIVWLVLEVTITELKGDIPIRKTDPENGLKILHIE